MRHKSMTNEPANDPNQWLTSLFPASTFGLAIFDNQFRYQAINDVLAAMNGVPAQTHLGKTPHAFLGKATAKVEAPFEHVLVTGQPVSNFEISAKLPRRTEVGHWILNYFPLEKDAAGKVERVGVVVVEVTKNRKIEKSIGSLRGKLLQLDAVLKMNMDHLIPHQSWRDERRELLTQSIELLERCILETRQISDLLHLPRVLNKTEALRRYQPYFLSQLTRILSEEGASQSPEGNERSATHLSVREREIVRLLGQSNSNKEVAGILDISVRTVETYRARIMFKLGLHSVSELVLYAVRNKIVET
jgi:DNA-binding CsgD family transcriptional regulator